MRFTSLFLAIALLLVVTLNSCNGVDSGSNCHLQAQYERCYIIRIIELLEKTETALKDLKKTRAGRINLAVQTLAQVKQGLMFIDHVAADAERDRLRNGPINSYPQEFKKWRARFEQISKEAKSKIGWHNRRAKVARVITLRRGKFGTEINEATLTERIETKVKNEPKVTEVYNDKNEGKEAIRFFIEEHPNNNEIAQHVRDKLYECHKNSPLLDD